jgi:cytochrome c-type biogenesis protein CcmF
MWGAVLAAGSATAVTVTRWRRAAGRLGVVALVLSAVALGALAWALLTGDFALAYVADTTTRQGGWPYRLAALWGGDAGSLLLWGGVILAVGVAASRRDSAARVVATAAGGAVVLVAAVADDPFRRLAIPAIDGGGLNPILQYPAMLYHPLLLYAGHAGMVAPFALALAALAQRRLDRAWLARTRKWMTGAWLVLGIGLVAGAHWAYVELGWGGFWGWDPVENSGLLPWLAATAFLHAAWRAARRPADGAIPVGVAVLAAIPFCVSVLGAAISRSGAAQSVHAFAHGVSVGRGLTVVLVVLVVTVAVLAARAHKGHGAVSVDTANMAVLGGVALLLATGVVVGIGTVFPVVAHAATGNTIAVTSRYYASVVTPLAVIGVLLMGVTPATGPNRWRLAGATMAAIVGATVVLGPGRVAPYALGASAVVALAVTASQLARTRHLRRLGALGVHAGMALLLVGVAGSLLGRQATQVVAVGGSMTVDGYTLQYRRVLVDQGQGWQRARTALLVDHDGRPIGTLTPGLRNFADQPAALSDIALHSIPAGDLIVALRAIDPGTNAAQLEVTVRPLVELVWWGGLLAGAGGLLVLLAGRTGRRCSPPAAVATSSGQPRVQLV